MPYHQVGDVIPDGQGGIIASWAATTEGYDGYTSPYPFTIRRIGTQDANQTVLPGVNGYGILPDSNMVLGDNGTAFADDNISVVAFDVATLQPKWNYSSASGLSLVAATAGGGVTVNDGLQGVIQLDANGTPSAPIPDLQGSSPFALGAPLFHTQGGSDLGLWGTTASGAASFVASLYLAPAPSPWIAPGADPTKNRSASPVPARIELTDFGMKKNFNGEPVVFNGMTFGGGALLWGYGRYVTYAVEDAQGKPIKQKGMTANEEIKVVDANPPQGITRFSPEKTEVSKRGVFHDTVTFGFPESPGPVAGQFIKDKQWLNVYTKAAAYEHLRINCVDKEFDDVAITDTTNNPGATCQ